MNSGHTQNSNPVVQAQLDSPSQAHDTSATPSSSLGLSDLDALDNPF